MRGKSKLVRCVFVALIALAFVLAFASCAPQAAPAPAAKPASMPAAVLAVPNLVEPGKSINVVGANFKPGEKVKVVMLMDTGGQGFSIEQGISFTEKEGELMAVDVNGSFNIATATPKVEGVWPIRVYDESGKMVASTAVWLKKAEKK